MFETEQQLSLSSLLSKPTKATCSSNVSCSGISLINPEDEWSSHYCPVHCGKLENRNLMATLCVVSSDIKGTGHVRYMKSLCQTPDTDDTNMVGLQWNEVTPSFKYYVDSSEDV